MFFLRSERVLSGRIRQLPEKTLYPAIELFEKPIRLDSWRKASRYERRASAIKKPDIAIDVRQV